VFSRVCHAPQLLISLVAMTMSQYLGRGAKSRGRMTITPNLGTIVSDVPYLKDEHDKAAVVQGIVNLQKALQNVEGLTWNFPPAGMTAQQYVDAVSCNLWSECCRSSLLIFCTDARFVRRASLEPLDGHQQTGNR